MVNLLTKVPFRLSSVHPCLHLVGLFVLGIILDLLIQCSAGQLIIIKRVPGWILWSAPFEINEINTGKLGYTAPRTNLIPELQQRYQPIENLMLWQRLVTIGKQKLGLLRRPCRWVISYGTVAFDRCRCQVREGLHLKCLSDLFSRKVLCLQISKP